MDLFSDISTGDMILTAGTALSAAALTLTLDRLSRWRQQQKFDDGDMTHTVQVTANYFDENGELVVMKPRIAIAQRDLAVVFTDPELCRLVSEAAERCEPSQCTAVRVELDEERQAEALRKAVVGLCSELTGVGHVRRMVYKESTIGREAYATICVAWEGMFKVVRIDMVDKKILPKFLDKDFVDSLRPLDESNSHQDMIDVFQDMAQDMFGPKDKRRPHRVYRVSLQFDGTFALVQSLKDEVVSLRGDVKHLTDKLAQMIDDQRAA